MDLVQKEHERLQKRLKASQSLKNIQSIIDSLQTARDVIASGECKYRAAGIMWDGDFQMTCTNMTYWFIV